MSLKFSLAMLLVILLATVNCAGRLQPSEEAGLGAIPATGMSLGQPTQASGRNNHAAKDGTSTDGTSSIHYSASSSGADSKQGAAVSLAGEVLQQLASQFELLQEHLQQLHEEEGPDMSTVSGPSRTLLEDSSNNGSAGIETAQLSDNGTATSNTATSAPVTINNSSSSNGSSDATHDVCIMWSSSVPAASTGNASTSTTSSTVLQSSTRNTNARRIGSRANLVVSDAWLVIWSGLQILQACVQMLGTLLAAAVDGNVVVDSQLVLRFADLGAAFSSGVSYLLYSIFLLTSDAVAPWV